MVLHTYLHTAATVLDNNNGHLHDYQVQTYLEEMTFNTPPPLALGITEGCEIDRVID